MKKYIEIGYGNTWFIRTEIEEEDGTECELRGIVRPFSPRSAYLRLWIGKKVVILDSREGLKLTTKNRRTVKIIIGLSGV
ncbi:MAG: hypothetical protein K0R57_2468 [Paenibacillaceae bacterium]|nr:hypothetical protein [Paenibacillaceae bacterium]